MKSFINVLIVLLFIGDSFRELPFFTEASASFALSYGLG